MDETLQIHVHAGISAIDPVQWDHCAGAARLGSSLGGSRAQNPFLSHRFLHCLEKSGSVGPGSGWAAHHLVLEDQQGSIKGCMPCYLKSHSRGEYVFDHAWSSAYERHGQAYYPKLISAVPFTPVPGRRLLVPPGPRATHYEDMLLAGAKELVRRHNLSSFHLTFVTKPEWERFSKAGFLQRTDQQFHFLNADFSDFECFLGSLASRKRKAVRRERRDALCADVSIERVSGSDITEEHWDAFYLFYQDTGARKWGTPYLNRRFFRLIGEHMNQELLLILARRDGRYIAGALNIIGSDTLYGRYWGALEHHPFLHFEICYYQAIEFAITHGLKKVEAGAQGEHKLARGYLPCPTYSLHYFADKGFSTAVERYLQQERPAVDEEIMAYLEHSPFRKKNL